MITFVLTILKVASTALAMRDTPSMRMDTLVMVCAVFIANCPFGSVCVCEVVCWSTASLYYFSDV